MAAGLYVGLPDVPPYRLEKLLDEAVTLYFAFKSMQAAREARGAPELRLSLGRTP